MTDRELLELAAKALGVEIGPDRVWNYWNPLVDNDDAFRLAVMLRMETYHADDGGWSAYASHPTARGIAYAIEPHGSDPCAATRRAIVRAAAEIGRME